METKSGPKLFTYAEHQQWHSDRQQMLLELVRDFKAVTGTPPHLVMELIGWNATQVQAPENPRSVDAPGPPSSEATESLPPSSVQ
jgi:hypothetical protein